MDVTAIQLLDLFLSKGSHTSLSLEKKFNLTKGQLDYRIKKVNQELADSLRWSECSDKKLFNESFAVNPLIR